jgi:hypothetical protein
MGYMKKDYWSTDPATETPILVKLMSRGRFGNIATSVITQKQKKMQTDYTKLHPFLITS